MNYNETFKLHKDHKADKITLDVEQVVVTETDFRKRIVEEMKDLEQGYSEVVDENFWELV